MPLHYYTSKEVLLLLKILYDFRVLRAGDRIPNHHEQCEQREKGRYECEGYMYALHRFQTLPGCIRLKSCQMEQDSQNHTPMQKKCCS